MLVDVTGILRILATARSIVGKSLPVAGCKPGEFDLFPTEVCPGTTFGFAADTVHPEKGEESMEAREIESHCRGQMEGVRAHLRELVEESGKSREEVARAVGLKPATLSQALRKNGTKRLSFDRVFAVLEALDVSPASFFEGLYGSR